jgi:hypothetical protein
MATSLTNRPSAEPNVTRTGNSAGTGPIAERGRSSENEGTIASIAA